jgi:hypothetical protein
MLKKIGAAFVLLVVAALGGAFLIPPKVEVSRSVTVGAAPEAVWPYLEDLRKFNDWQPWLSRDPNVVMEYGATTVGLGATYSWRSEQRNVGVGSMTITELEPMRRVRSHMVFEGQGEADADLILQAEGDGTLVTWTYHGDAGMNPIGRYFNLAMDSMLGPDFETGLRNLQGLIAAAPAPAPPAEGSAAVEAAAAVVAEAASPTEGSGAMPADGSGAMPADGPGAADGSAAPAPVDGSAAPE